MSEKIRSQRGASVVFALVGFMFAAMISFVVINAAFSAASRVKKLKYDEQAFLLAQSMSGVIIEALSGSGAVAEFPTGNTLKTPEGNDLKYDALTLSYRYIEQKDATGTAIRYYNASEADTEFKKPGPGEEPKTFNAFVGKTSLSSAGTAVQTMVYGMAQKIGQGTVDTMTETIKTNYENPHTHDKYDVETVFTMNKSLSINAVTTAKVLNSAGVEQSKYIVRMDASAAVRTDKYVCVGEKDAANETITVDYSDVLADVDGEELVKVSRYSVTWPVDQLRNVYVAP
ncbi:hypothetical protein [Butyrivibrio sp. FCS014]|uniref:hypothetical protein n=1 Tax=Butyrivibrio sp. FCS014 TaxID=1408304 RepID=UPI00046791EE|nr:hypothetical protein [Butyrivibrio sp. FCS014]